MSDFEFRKGDRVQWRRFVNSTGPFSDSLYRGTVDYVRDGVVYGTRDGGGQFARWPWGLTKEAPAA